MTFDNVLDSVIELPAEQQRSLIDIIENRLSELRREEIFNLAKKEKEKFKSGKFKSETAKSLIARLHKNLDEK